MHLLDKVCNAAAAVHEEEGIHVVACPSGVGDSFEAGSCSIGHLKIRVDTALEARVSGETAAAERDAGVTLV